MIRLAIVMALILGTAAPSTADSRLSHGCESKACKARVKAKQERREMQRYKKKPMPACTWVAESGPVTRSNPQWSGKRYRVWNGGSYKVPPRGFRERASGKYQFVRNTWKAVGGLRYADAAALATRVIQERLARKLLREGGLGHWERC